MRISTFWYCLKQGVINICRNILFSLASIATVSACIFLFCLFFSIMVNVQYVVKNTESTVGITVFFNEGLDKNKITEIGNEIKQRKEVKEVKFTSAEDAWSEAKKEYFGDMQDLAEGFEEDNPLANSSSYSIFLNDLTQQDELVSWLNGIEGVRKVNYSKTAAEGMNSLNKVIGILSMLIIGILLAVAIFLISNTISVAAAFRKNENQIMKLIGATNYMIRAPFVVEGVIIGLVGASLPLIAIYFLYRSAVGYVVTKFSILSGLFQFLPVDAIFPYMAATAMSLGLGIGFFVSFFTIRKHLKV
ncbi:cell division transport system permease protein [Lacrimispora xylanisolvens]|uniref:Cell division protein FtsX n=1 Tax=Lacrimispora xylanisolvens TaxID=384636 RepID=A0A2S6HCI7_9FIRM|nr:permease-like cell division protein FtsX [Hungatella xylanolytica]MBE5982887.1 ABC transporter permease [Paenibacillaceae bacterium]MTK09873.1 ABC transporter permease [Hungatella sp.]MBE5988686.1 ABC transporter permease [Paenibacillaceae bacterium]MBE5991959.1 ABC transporter permease [Paenibacillaceae bacterium]PPK75121.1 cell division transport system permease protein [Hungatella xylanolytica]